MNIDLNLQIIISFLFVIFGCLAVMVGILTLVTKQGYKKINCLLEKIDGLFPDKQSCDKSEDKPEDNSCEKPCDSQCEKPCKKSCDSPGEKPCDRPCEKPSEDKPQIKEKSKKDVSFIEEQWIRQMSKTASPFLNKLVGNYYWALHAFIMVTSGTILLFDNNVYHLLILLNIACMDAVACIFLHDCPLTILEKKYLKTSFVRDKYNCLKHSPILYRCNHDYEKTLEFLINMVCFIFGKMISLLILKLLNIKFAPVE